MPSEACGGAAGRCWWRGGGRGWCWGVGGCVWGRCAGRRWRCQFRKADVNGGIACRPVLRPPHFAAAWDQHPQHVGAAPTPPSPPPAPARPLSCPGSPPQLLSTEPGCFLGPNGGGQALRQVVVRGCGGAFAGPPGPPGEPPCGSLACRHARHGAGQSLQRQRRGHPVAGSGRGGWSGAATAIAAPAPPQRQCGGQSGRPAGPTHPAPPARRTVDAPMGQRPAQGRLAAAPPPPLEPSSLTPRRRPPRPPGERHLP